MDGERSGLFMEQVRLTKEMRENDRKSGRTGDMVRPRFMVWENVPGAFSSNGGKDFQAVLTEICKIAEPECPDVPLPDKGKWSKSGALFGMGNNGCPFSIAWRVHDAQFWGVPQRRKRISLVADFGGLSAPEILFEREGLSGDSEQSGEAGQETAGAAGGGVEGAEPILLESNQNHATVQTDGISTALPASMGMGGGYVPMVTAYGISSYDSNAMKSPNPHSGIYEADTARTLDLNGGSPACNQGGIAVVQSVGCDVYNQPVVVDGVLPFDTTQITSPQNGSHPHYGDPCHPLAAGAHPPAVAIGNGQLNQMSMAEQANTLDTMHDQQAVMVAAVDCRNGTENPNINGTLQAKSTGGTGTNFNNVLRANAIVRRLTPLECERLQGYPDGWTDIGEWVDGNGKKHKDADSPRYKALGNSIALPFWQWMFGRIVEQYPAERRDKLTLGSLFDGIGGFPLTAQRNGIEPVWASEIEEFPIAVTKVRFPDEPV